MVSDPELSVTDTGVFLTMRGTSGSTWMPDNVDPKRECAIALRLHA